jgi:uroporphyrinogen III methyltransferase/synthase
MNKVYLVGAGPGDPELITLKARRLLGAADVVLHDHLANPQLLALAPASAELIYVGKKKSDHAVSQEEICGLLIEHWRRGQNVVRLKGGDPFIFGRGGEEAEALADAGVPFEIVPGVTSPLGIAAYTGVPLTHRDHTSVVTFITGHDVEKIDWRKVGTSETLVIFMGLSHFDDIAARVIEGGRDASTPAIAVRWGTKPDQEVVRGTLATLPQLLHERGMKPPATIIVGDVVSLRDKLSWFEKLPLFAQRIVVTRAKDQADSMCGALRQSGAEVVELPTIEIRDAPDYRALDAAIARLGEYQWLIFTSVNGVKYFLDRLDAGASDLRAIRGKLCAIGPATREALEQFHLKVDVVAEQYVAEGLLNSLSGFDLDGARVLIARAAVARDVLPDELRRRGAKVDVVEAYRTGAPATLAASARVALEAKPDWITFTSSSTASNLIEACGVGSLHGVKIASIGPVTSETLRKAGLQVTVEASPHTVPALIDAIRAAAIIKT